MQHYYMTESNINIFLEATIDRERTLNKYGIDLELNQLKTVETMLYPFIKVTNLLTDCSVGRTPYIDALSIYKSC